MNTYVSLIDIKIQENTFLKIDKILLRKGQ